MPDLEPRRFVADIGHQLNQDANLLPAFLHRYDREHTRRAYRNDLVQFFQTDVVTADLVRQVTFLHINQHLADVEKAGMKASSMKRRIAALRGFFDWCEALELIDKNPANRQLVRRIRRTAGTDRTIVYLTQQQAQALVDATKLAGEAAVRDRALILTMLHCVLRRSEAVAMNVDHIRPIGHYWILDLPLAKGGADQYVKIPAHIVEEIEDVKRYYDFQHGPVWRSLSNNSRNARLTPDGIYKIVTRTALRAGLSATVGAHTLRHTGCTLAIEAGAAIHQVQNHARHKKIETTMAYVHQRDRLRDSAADFIHLPESKEPPLADSEL